MSLLRYHIVYWTRGIEVKEIYISYLECILALERVFSSNDLEYWRTRTFPTSRLIRVKRWYSEVTTIQLMSERVDLLDLLPAPTAITCVTRTL